MSTALKNIAPALARAWVWLYTSGMPSDLGQARRAEVDGDLWEHQQDAGIRGEPDMRVAVEILLRTVLGIPDDIGWRLEAARERRGAVSREGSGTMTVSVGQMRWMGLGALLAGAVIVGVRIVDVVLGQPGRVVSPSGNALRFAGTAGVLVLLVLAAQGLLSMFGVLGLRAQQRGRTVRPGSLGFILLLAGFGSATAAMALQASVIAFGLTDSPAVWVLVNLLTVPAYVLLIPLGFLLAGSGLPSPSRRIPLMVGSYLVVQPWVMFVLGARVPSVVFLFGSAMSSVMLAFGVAAIGWMVWSGTRGTPPLQARP